MGAVCHERLRLDNSGNSVTIGDTVSPIRGKAILTEEEFTSRIEQTARNLEGQRPLAHHVALLAPEIGELRADCVSWDWIAARIGPVRTMAGGVKNWSARIRAAWSKGKAKAGINSTGLVRQGVTNGAVAPAASSSASAGDNVTAQIMQRASRREQGHKHD